MWTSLRSDFCPGTPDFSCERQAKETRTSKACAIGKSEGLAGQQFRRLRPRLRIANGEWYFGHVTSTVLSIVAILASLAVAGALVWTLAGLRGSFDRPPPVPDPSPTEGWWKSLEGLEDRTLAELKRLTLAVEEGIERVQRAETRIAKTVKGARKLVADHGLEHAGLEAEADEIRERDEPASDPEGVPPVRSVLEDDRPSGIPGISVSEYQRLVGEAAE